MSDQAHPRLQVGISQCLLGAHVRYDGGHKRYPFLADVLSRYVDYVPVCPEVEAGLGTPREAMRLEGSAAAPRLVTVRTRMDQTHLLNRFAARRAQELLNERLSGYVFKKDSPSCGMGRVRLYADGLTSRRGIGLFASALMRRYPLLPMEEEGRLEDARLREHFIERLYAHRRWQDFRAERQTRRGLVAFHQQHKYLLLAHSRPHYERLGRLVAHAAQNALSNVVSHYERVFMEALTIPTTARKHVNVLQHMIGSFRRDLSGEEQADLDIVIEDYRQGLTPLVAPLTLIRHYVSRRRISYLAEQVYLNPYPKALMLRNAI